MGENCIGEFLHLLLRRSKSGKQQVKYRPISIDFHVHDKTNKKTTPLFEKSFIVCGLSGNIPERISHKTFCPFKIALASFTAPDN